MPELADLLGEDEGMFEHLRDTHDIRDRVGLQRLADLDESEWVDAIRAQRPRGTGAATRPGKHTDDEAVDRDDIAEYADVWLPEWSGCFHVD